MNDMKLPKSYDYKVKIWVSVFGSVFLGTLSLLVFYLAYNNERGLVIEQLFSLNIVQTSLAFATFGALLAYFSYGALQGLLLRNNADRKIIISIDTITAPKSISSKKIITIKLSDMHHLKMVKRSAQTFIRIRHPSGQLNIAAIGLKNDDFVELYQYLNLNYEG